MEMRTWVSITRQGHPPYVKILQGMKTTPKGWQVWLKLSRKTLAKDYSKQQHHLSIAVDMYCNGWNFQLMWQSYVLHFLDNIQWLGFSTDVVILNFWLFKTYICWNFQRMWQSCFWLLRNTIAGTSNRSGNTIYLTFETRL